VLETMSSRELEDVAADEWLDYDIRIAAQTEIYRRQYTPEGARHEGIQKE